MIFDFHITVPMITRNDLCLQLFRERLSNKTLRDNAERYYGQWGSWSLIEALGVSATSKETAQTSEFTPSPFLLVNTVIFNQSTPSSSVLPIIPIGIVAYAFTLLWDNLCRNGCI